ncbi:MAG: diguanylate cyclase [Gammaproteobacteria bacterium]|nr:diguanylate cyclase [Gammaproteobacteria bacterium]
MNRDFCYKLRPMEETIYKENRLLRRKLDSLLRQARTNEKKQELFDSFGFEIIGTNSPAQLRDLLLFQMQARFQLQDVILCIVDYDKDTDRLFYGHDEEARAIFQQKFILLDTEKNKDKIKTLRPCPSLGSKVLDQYSWMVSELEDHELLESAAYLPLIRTDKIIGALLLVSRDNGRYQTGHGTEFLQKLSAMTAVAIENCLNQQRVKEIGYQDALTQAYNRRYFDLRFKDEIERSLRRDEDLACMFLDVDHFKKVNDTYGHHIGDLVLMRMVALIKEQVRACDIVARYGGEEFVVALPATSLDVATEIAERLRLAVNSDTQKYYDKNLNISISIGMTTLKHLDSVDRKDSSAIASALIDRADQSLYRAKESGRNRVVIYLESWE